MTFFAIPGKDDDESTFVLVGASISIRGRGKWNRYQSFHVISNLQCTVHLESETLIRGNRVFSFPATELFLGIPEEYFVTTALGGHD